MIEAVLKYLCIGLLVVSGLLGLRAWQLQHRVEAQAAEVLQIRNERDMAQEALKTALQARARDAQVLTRLREENALQARKLALARASLADALAAAQEWRDTPVPSGVLEILNAE
jgi:hypothetical protein